jgi:hypothetical protein
MIEDQASAVSSDAHAAQSSGSAPPGFTLARGKRREGEINLFDREVLSKEFSKRTKMIFVGVGDDHGFKKTYVVLPKLSEQDPFRIPRVDKIITHAGYSNEVSIPLEIFYVHIQGNPLS